MKTVLKSVFLIVLVLPLTLFLDLILFSLIKTCPACGSYWQFVETEGALSFPIVVGITEWVEGLAVKYLPGRARRHRKH